MTCHVMTRERTFPHQETLRASSDVHAKEGVIGQGSGSVAGSSSRTRADDRLMRQRFGRTDDPFLQTRRDDSAAPTPGASPPYLFIAGTD